MASEVIRPSAEACDAEARWPEAGIRALMAADLAGLVAPQAHGGQGLGLRALIEVCEVIGREDASCGLCFGMHSVAVACIAHNATPHHVETLLRPICRGEHWTTLALSEPGTGSHFYLPQLRMSADGADYLLHGEKSFVTNGAHADSYVVSTMAAEPDAPPGHFSLVVVPRDTEGMTWGREWQGWGMRGNSSRSVTFERARVPRMQLLGAEGDQIWYAFNIVAPYFLVAMAGTYLGAAAHALDEALAHLKSRTYSHSGGSLAEIDVLQHRVGTVWAQLERTRRLCYWAAEAGDAQHPDALAALCSAKAEVATAAVHIVNECMTLMGGIAYRDGSVLQRLLRDVRAAHVMAPTTDMLYSWAGRALLGLPILGG